MQTLPQKPPGGASFTSLFIGDLSGVTSAPTTWMQVFSGMGYGFVFEPFGEYAYDQMLVVLVRGIGKKGLDKLYVQPGKWYDLPFSALQIVADDNVAGVYAGGYLLNIACQPFSFVRPGGRGTLFSQTPAVIGGMPPAVVKIETQDLTRLPPTLGTEGVLLNQLVPTSLFAVDVETLLADNITGGVIDIYGYTAVGATGSTRAWALMMQGVPLPTGAAVVRVPFGSELALKLGVRSNTNAGITRVLAALNGVLTDGASVQARVFMRAQ